MSQREEIFSKLRDQGGVLAEFNDSELTEIITKAHGVCYLCLDPLDYETDKIHGDHIEPDEGDRPENICLTHKKCNERKRDLPLGLAKIYFQLEKFSKSFHDLPSFDDALDYFKEENRKVISYNFFSENNVEYVNLIFGDAIEVRTPVYKDPTTSIKYTFCTVPISNLYNDTEAQPRKITTRHVWRLLLDFTQHPIHEPSSVRLVTVNGTGTGKFLLCDGQHKALAQLLLGRDEIQTKIYIDPDIKIMRTLIDTIQNRIRKLPLYPSIVMEKLGVIHRDRWQEYQNTTSAPYTEAKFIKTYRSDEQTNLKRQLKEAIYNSILYGERKEDEMKILKYVEAEKRRAGKDKIMTMNLLKTTVLKNLVFQKPANYEVGSESDMRLKEVHNLRKFLDIFVEVFFEDDLGIQKERTEKMKRIFKSGSVRAWTRTVKSAINRTLNIIDHQEFDKTMLRPIQEHEWEAIKSILQRLEQHALWDDNAPSVESQLNENKLETTQALFDDYSIPLNAAYLINA